MLRPPGQRLGSVGAACCSRGTGEAGPAGEEPARARWQRGREGGRRPWAELGQLPLVRGRTGGPGGTWEDPGPLPGAAASGVTQARPGSAELGERPPGSTPGLRPPGLPCLFPRGGRRCPPPPRPPDGDPASPAGAPSAAAAPALRDVLAVQLDVVGALLAEPRAAVTHDQLCGHPHEGLLHVA